MPAFATTIEMGPSCVAHAGDDGLHRLEIGYVGLERKRPVSDLGGRALHRLEVEVDHRDEGAAPLELPCRGEADALLGAGDERHLAVDREAAHARRSYVLAVKRPLPPG